MIGNETKKYVVLQKLAVLWNYIRNNILKGLDLIDNSEIMF